MRQRPSGPETLIVDAVFPAATPEAVFPCWTEPARLRQWWPSEADLDARPGGAYLLAWPAQDWRLRGHYTVFQPPHALAFTWAWDHEPEAPARLVTIHIAPGAPGARLTLEHGPYARTAEDQAVREAQHLAGWAHFLPRLEALLAANGTG
jgi:uncharacterized protein YndB with AHSA1/START domain